MNTTHETKKWFDYAGDDSDVIVSTRVCVARNLAGFPFAWKMRASDRKTVLRTVLEAAQSSRLAIAGQERVCQHLIGPVLQQKARMAQKLQFHSKRPFPSCF